MVASLSIWVVLLTVALGPPESNSRNEPPAPRSSSCRFRNLDYLYFEEMFNIEK